MKKLRGKRRHNRGLLHKALYHRSVWSGAVLLGIGVGIALLLEGAVSLPWSGRAKAFDLPNVVFIMLDDVDMTDFSVYTDFGAGDVKTPNIDALASQGMRFTNYFSNGAQCSPTRAGLLTGQYPSRFGITQTIPGESYRGVPTTFPLSAELFKQAGYATAHIGKWHLGKLKEEFFAENRGFDYAATLSNFVDTQNYQLRMSTPENPGPWIQDSNGKNLSNMLADQALTFIEDNADGPFFLNLWERAPHEPLSVPPNYDNSETRYDLDTKRGQLGAMVTHADSQLQRVVDKLDELGIAENTLVIVTSDNGGTLNAHSQPEKFLTGQKGDVFEAGIHVPFIVRWPSQIQPGMVNPSLAIGFDLLPTFAEILGIDIADWNPEGQSLISAFLGQNLGQERQLFWEVEEDEPDNGGDLYKYAVRDGKWKLIEKAGTTYLFNLSKDPKEKDNVADKQNDVVKDLRQAYKAWRKEVGDIAYSVESLGGDATQNGDTFEFPSNGIVNLANTTLFDFHDGEFSFLTRVTPTNVNSRHVIAEKADSWRLLINNGELEATVQGADGQSIRLQSQGANIRPNRTYHVALTVMGWKHVTSEARLYLDGQMVDISADVLKDVASNDATITLGNDWVQGKPFTGSMELPRLSVQSLTAGEIKKSSDGPGL